MRITETQFQHDYKVCRLKENVKIDAFCCGDEDLDDFILNESSFYTKALISVTYIVLDKRQNLRSIFRQCQSRLPLRNRRCLQNRSTLL